MLQRLLKLVLADLARPWGLMTKICAVGCAASLAYIEFSLHNSRLMPGHGWLDLSALCLLFTSAVTGIIAIARNTRNETSTMVPIIVLCVTLKIGWLYALMGLVEIPSLILEWLFHVLFESVYLATALLVAVGVVLLVLRRKLEVMQWLRDSLFPRGRAACPVFQQILGFRVGPSHF